jgi:hypothetical protein
LFLLKTIPTFAPKIKKRSLSYFKMIGKANTSTKFYSICLLIVSLFFLCSTNLKAQDEHHEEISESAIHSDEPKKEEAIDISKIAFEHILDAQ